MQAVILAGGKGTRLRDRLGDLPKPMVDICGRPLLEHQIRLLRAHGFKDVLLLLNYNPESICSYFGDGSAFGVRVQYVVEQTPLGSAGAVLGALEFLHDRFAVLYGDTMLNVDLERFWKTHASRDADATIFLHPNDHPHDSDLVEVDDGGVVEAFHPYPRPGTRYYPNLVNAALYVVERRAMVQWRHRTDSLDFARDLFPAMVKAGQQLIGYRSREYIKDAGTPERLDRVIADYSSGKIERGSLASAAPAVFIDRDGTINEEVNRVKTPGEFRLLPGVAKAIRKLNDSEYKVVVITNQPVIARGDCTERMLREIHNKMETELGEARAFVDAIFYCPHHPDSGFADERTELKIDCSCRKPSTGLITRACAEMNLDLSRSWLIGDSCTDVRTARNAGVPSILVETGLGVSESDVTCKADYCFPALYEASEFLTAGGGAAR
jgi:histidinol-phosphate phosphatase family protein